MAAFDPLRTLEDVRDLCDVSEQVPTGDEPSRGGCFLSLALFIGPFLVVAIWRPRSLILSEEWPFLLLQGLWLALPFGYLALNDTKKWLPWAVAAFLTIACWGLLLKFAGPGLGAALISFAIPLFITTVTWAATNPND